MCVSVCARERERVCVRATLTEAEAVSGAEDLELLAREGAEPCPPPHVTRVTLNPSSLSSACGPRDLGQPPTLRVRVARHSDCTDTPTHTYTNTHT
eukprot:155205-Rhodomonas_salina.1